MKKGLLTGVVVLVGVLLALLVRHRLILMLLLVNGVVCHIDLSYAGCSERLKNWCKTVSLMM